MIAQQSSSFLSIPKNRNIYWRSCISTFHQLSRENFNWNFQVYMNFFPDMWSQVIFAKTIVLFAILQCTSSNSSHVLTLFWKVSNFNWKNISNINFEREIILKCNDIFKVTSLIVVVLVPFFPIGIQDFAKTEFRETAWKQGSAFFYYFWKIVRFEFWK